MGGTGYLIPWLRVKISSNLKLQKVVSSYKFCINEFHTLNVETAEGKTEEYYTNKKNIKLKIFILFCKEF